MDRRLAEWFAGRGVGTSSKAIALYLSAGVSADGPPSDPSDLERCIALLDQIPEWWDRMSEMAGAGDRWKPFAEKWSDLVALFREEKGANDRRNWSAPRTYEMMQELHGRAGRKPGFYIEIGR